MATNPKDTKARKSIGKFARALLATTCLTVATSGAAAAASITYSESGDFSDTFAGVQSLTAAAIPGTTIVQGFVSGEDTLDYFELTGLGAGNFTVHASESEGGAAAQLTVFDTTGSILEGPTAFSFGAATNIGTQAIPANGDVVVKISGFGISYQVNVDTVAPEPGTIATAALGLAGAVALKRRRRKQ